MTARLVATTEEIRRHARRVESIAGESTRVLEAAAGTTVSADAFGRLCSFVHGALAPLQVGGVAACAATVGSLSLAAAELHGTATGIDVADRIADEAARLLGGRVDDVRRLPWPGSVVVGAAHDADRDAGVVA